jgi:hypothetical protein
MSKTRSASSNLGDSVIQAGQLQDSSYKNQASLPTQSENDAQLFADIGKSFSAPGDRPRGGARNLGAGFAKGLEYGAKSNAISEKKENFGKYQKQMDYLKSVQGEVVKQNQWHAEQEKRLETVKPFAVGGLEISYSGMDYATGNDRMRNVMEQAKLADPTIKGDYIGYVPNSPIVNMRDEKGNIIAYSLSNLAGEDVVQRVQKNYIDQQKADTESKYAPIKYQIMGEKLEETKRRTDAAGLKHDLKLTESFGKKIDASKEFLTIVPHMREILKDHSDIFQSAGDVIWRDSQEPGYMDAFIKSAHSKMAPDKATAITKMIKYINKMTLDVANGFARPNMYVEKVGGKAVPNLDMTAQGFSEILDEMELENKESLQNNLKRLQLLESDVGSGIADQYQGSTNEVMGNNNPKPNPAPQDEWSNIWKPIS